LLGHYVGENPTDSSLRQTVTTLGYLDYYTTKPVPFPSISVGDKELKTNVRVFASDLKAIKELQEKWELPNQQVTVKNLIELAQKAKELEEKLLDAQSQLSEFKNQKVEIIEELDMENLESKISRILDEKLSQLLPQLEQVEATSKNNKTDKGKPKEDDPDLESISSEELRENKSGGAAQEKLRRSFLAITDNNDHKARDNNGQPDTDKMWVINNQALRQLSGCNGMLVKDWMTRHKQAIDDHNSKYGLGTYHNKGRGDITEAISW
jgi:molybdopterin converting factor small subunit